MQGPTDSSRVGVEGTTGEIRCEASDMDNGHDNTGGSNGDETTDVANIGTNTGGSNRALLSMLTVMAWTLEDVKANMGCHVLPFANLSTYVAFVLVLLPICVELKL